MMDLATYTPMGDKKNSDFFEEYLPKVYERREASGLNQIVGNTAALVVQVEHGDAVDYMAELTAMGPYRFQAARLTGTHKVYVLQSQPDYPRLIVLEPLSATYEDNITRWNMLYPLARKKPNARYIGEVYQAQSTQAVRDALEPQNIRFAYPGDTVSDFYTNKHLTFTFMSDFTYNRVGLRRRRHRRPGRARARRDDRPHRGGAGQARARRRPAGRARHHGPRARRGPRSHPDPRRRP